MRILWRVFSCARTRRGTTFLASCGPRERERAVAMITSRRSRRRFDAARGNDTIAPIGGRHWGVRDGISFVYALNRDHGVHSRRENHECSRREPTADQKLA